MKSAFIVLFLAFQVATLNSQTTVNIPRLNETIILDGMPDEEAWRMTEPFNLVMHIPMFGKEPSENTDIRLFFNDKYLYIGAKLYYSDITLMAKPGKQRDYFSSSCEYFGLLLDTFNDDENMLGFFTNPNGLRLDASVKSDAAMGMEDINVSWNTFWDVGTTFDENGWYAEFRIPVSSLRFQVENDTVRMGITLFRYMPKKNEIDVFPAIDPSKGEMAYWKSSLAAPVEFIGMEPDKPIYITPYISGGIERVNTLNAMETGYKTDLLPSFNAGVDMKIGLSNNLILDLTVNTDFAQVEADAQQINLTRFSLFFPEKRPFFLEKSDVFNFDLLGANNLFYSRRIGLHEGSPVSIIGGARITGRVGEWDIGLLDMQTSKFEDLSGENFGVLRTKRTIFNSNSYIGSMVTSRLGTDGSYNVAYGIDGVFRMFRDDYLTLRWAQTFEDGATNDFLSRDPSRLLVRWENRNMKGISYDFAYSWSGSEFNPGVGLEIIDNYYIGRVIIKYGWFPEDEKSKLRTHNLSQSVTPIYSSLDYNLLTLMSMTKWDFSTRTGYSGNVTVNFFREIVADTLNFSGALIPPGTYNFLFLSTLINLTPSINPGLQVTAEAGQFYDGIKASLNLISTWNVSPSLDINPTYKIDRVSFEDRGQSFTNHIFGLKTRVMVSTKLSITSFTQYNTSIEAWLINARFRYNPREGNDFFIVYNEGLNTSLYREIPILPRSDTRTILLKYTYTFGL
ncbi:MAG: hypothetical protein E4G95_00460 [Bacteroidia bacterium]|nr:MAG: hypothetical protein E4G95_00460 [Bacteroidia bacterium]